MRIDNARLYSASIENGAQATGSLLVSGSMTVDGLVTATSFSGDGSSLTGVTGEWDGTRDGDAEITGSLIITQALTASGVISGSTILGERIDASLRVETSQINQASDTLDIYGATSILGSLTASGAISASGNILGNNFYGGVFGRIYPSSAQTSNNQFFTSDANGINSNSSFNVTGHITASGNISASGNFFGDEFNAHGNDANSGFTLLSLGDKPSISAIGASVQIGNATNSSQTGISLVGEVTASGDISGSASSTGSFGSMVLTSPDGTAYLLTVNNDGHFSLTGSAV